ncbi:ArsR family transcriptional regulator (plasmid) [Sulfolobus tengchongensis]
MTYKRNLTAKEKILLVLAEKGSCSLEELERYTGIKRNVLLVHLTQLAKEGIVYRGWGHFGADFLPALKGEGSPHRFGTTSLI